MIPLYKSATIVIVDDDEDDYFLTSDYIRSIPGNNFNIEWCSKYNDGIERLLKNNEDLFLVDYRLGAKSGVDFLKEARKFKCTNPIILLTGKGNYMVDIQAMEFGAVDYLVKTELNVEKMERCIRYALDRAATIQALLTNERKYRNIFEKSKDVVFVTDSALNFIDVNTAIFNLLGYTQQEVLTKNIVDIIDPIQLRKAKIAEILAARNEVNDLEVVLFSKDGEKKICSLSLIFDDVEGENKHLQGIIHDITSLKKMEKANLQGEKLAAAGRLVRTIAHEVRNPLNNITLSIEQLLFEAKDESQQLYLNIIQRNSKRINDLISELLQTSRPAENKLELHTLQRIVDDVITVCIDRLTLKHMKLQVHHPENEIIVLADYEKLKLALLNIFINAIEAMDEQTGVLSISITENNKTAVLTISDNGCGISEENISRLFEPYFTQKRNGVGLGLTFTLNILQAHKADIEVTSQAGKGTSFIITFPAIHGNDLAT